MPECILHSVPNECFSVSGGEQRNVTNQNRLDYAAIIRSPKFQYLIAIKVYFMLMLHVLHGLTGNLLLIADIQGVDLRSSHHFKHCRSSCSVTQRALKVLALASKDAAQKGHTFTPALISLARNSYKAPSNHKGLRRAIPPGMRPN